MKSYLQKRKKRGRAIHIYLTCVTFASVGILLLLLSDLLRRGIAYLDWDFITGFPSRFASKSGVLPALLGSLWLIGLTTVIAVPVAIGAAIYLEEYAKDNRLTRFIMVNIANLAGIPSIVYGILGLTIFVRTLALGRSILSGALTLSLLVFPIIIVTTQEAIKTVPDEMRHGSYALGATKWQTIRRVVLPGAMPGILTGIILSVARALGESAPLLLVGAFSYVSSLPQNPMDSFIALPIQIYTWTSKPNADFRNVTAAAILVLLALMLLCNGLALVLRSKQQKKFE